MELWVSWKTRYNELLSKKLVKQKINRGRILKTFKKGHKYNSLPLLIVLPAFTSSDKL